MKILIADNISEKAAKILQAENSWQVVNLPKEKNRPLIEEIRDAEALVVRSATKVTAELLERAPKLRAVGRAGVGVDNVDMDAATRHGIVVMNTPGGNAASVAEQTLGFMVCLARHIPQADASVKVGKWEKKKLTGSELRGKTLGLIGFGRVGSEVARLARAFEMQVIAYDPYVGSRLATEQGMKLVSLTDVLAESDYLSLHCSLTPETNHLLNAERLALTRRGIRIINCARGELIDEKALLAAIESGQVAGAALDVFEVEPPKDSALVRHPSVIATPHIAGSTEEAQEIVGIAIAEQVRDFLKYGTPRNAVNLPAVTAEEFQKLQPYLELGEKLGSFLAQVAGELPNAVCDRVDRMDEDLITARAAAQDGRTLHGRRPARAAVTSVFSPKGGVGKSVLAVNLAAALAQSCGQPVAILDLDLQFGDVSVMMRLQPAHTLSDAISAGDLLDETLLRSFLVRHDKSGVYVLGAPTSPSDADQVEPATILRVLELMREMFAHVIIDTPPHLSEVVLQAVAESDLVAFLVAMDVPSVKNARLGLQAFELLRLPMDKVLLVLNRADSKVHLAPHDVERALELRVHLSLPSDPVVPQSVNQGVPVQIAYPRSRFAGQVAQLAEIVMSRAEQSALER